MASQQADRKRSRMMDNTIGYYRRLRGMTQAQLAELTAVKVGTIQKLESGERSIMKAQLDTILPLARALSVTVEELAGETGES